MGSTTAIEHAVLQDVDLLPGRGAPSLQGETRNVFAACAVTWHVVVLVEMELRE